EAVTSLRCYRVASVTRTAGALIGCRRLSAKGGLGCPVLHHEIEDSLIDWSAKTIADIYKQRWQVELFFKWIKQNLKIKAFLGNTDNAVMTQVFVALCVYLILAYLKFQAKISQSLQQMSRLIHLNLFAKRDLIQLFKPPPELSEASPQLRLV
ncbi:MAG: transposase, partial [Candidatus Sedimenticola sp. (ex Thyasira tokunagai)]